MNTAKTAVEVLDPFVETYDAKGLADAVSRAVADGVLAPGTRLPPIRRTASELQLSPTTVSAAWALLVRAGLIETDGRRGTFVADSPAAREGRYRDVPQRQVDFRVDLSTGVPDPALLPDLGPALGRLGAAGSPETYLDDPVIEPLREVLAARMPFDVAELTIADGAMDALDLIVTTLFRFGDRVAVEEPCFPPLLDLLKSAGLRVIAVGLDADGPRVSDVARAVEAGARALFYQPRAQNPSGVTMTRERAAGLARVLSNRDVLVVENDSMGEIASSEAVSLAAELPEQTLHIHSFSKSHGPDLRLAAVAGPATLVDHLVRRRFLGQSWTSRLLQRLLLDLLTDPVSCGQVADARNEYSRRRLALVHELGARGIESTGVDGLNLWLPVVDEGAALISLTGNRVGVAPGSPFMIEDREQPHVRVTVGLLSHEQEAVADLIAAAAQPAAWTSRR